MLLVPEAQGGLGLTLTDASLVFETFGETLAPGGAFVAKVFQSGADAELLATLKRDFRTVKHVKPSSSRQDSSERYLLATGFRGTAKDSD